MSSLIKSLGSESSQQDTPKQSCNKKRYNRDSILNSVDSGFGSGNILIKDCPKPKFKTPLFKEDYLNDFISETEKRLVRYNLGIVGESEVIELVNNIVKDEVESFITIEKAEELMSKLNIVDTKLNSTADYVIPDKLFKL